MQRKYKNRNDKSLPVDSNTNPEEIKIVVHSESVTEPKPAPREDRAPSPFDRANFCINPDYSGLTGTKVVRTLPCRKPNKQEFVRARP